MKKFSKEAFVQTFVALLSAGITSLAGAALFWGFGVGREYYQTSTPEQLYGVFGWFSISYYFWLLLVFCLVALFILIVIGSSAFDLQDTDDDS